MVGKTLISALLIALVLTLTLGFAGCANPSVPVANVSKNITPLPPAPPMPPVPPINNTPVPPVSPINSTPVPPVANTSANLSGKYYDSVSDSNNAFAFDLYSKYKSKDGNVFFSPFSISSALAMTYEGAKGTTADEMRSVFHFSNDSDKLRTGYADIFSSINDPDKPYILSTANSLWAQKDYPFTSGYFDTVSKYYGGTVSNLDFKADTENSRKTINSWVSNKTYDRINDIIPSGFLSPDTRLVLVNAIYFKANWSVQFDNYSTYDQNFTLEDGSKVTSKMMHDTEHYNYFENNELKMIELPYQGNDVSMFVLLPKGDMGALENRLTSDNLALWQKQTNNERVSLSLPKFKFGSKYFMTDDLAAMGMPTAFRYPDADFTGMSPTGELYIGFVIHQTFIEVSETGTEAAAATVVGMSAGMAPFPTQPPKEFTADHPFIFVIQDKKSGSILFMGKVRDPNAE